MCMSSINVAVLTPVSSTMVWACNDNVAMATPYHILNGQ